MHGWRNISNVKNALPNEGIFLLSSPPNQLKEINMGKSQDTKKEAKKEPAKTLKEKRAEKKVKQDEKKRIA